MHLAGFRQGDNLQIDLRTTAMPTGALFAIAGLDAIEGGTVLLGRVGWRGDDLNATLQAITDSEPLARFAPCIDVRRLNLQARARRTPGGREAIVDIGFGDGFSLDIAASLGQDESELQIATSRFALAPCGAVMPELGLTLSGSVGLTVDLLADADGTNLAWSSDLDGVSLQFHELFQSPLPVERFRGDFAGLAEGGIAGRGELVLADLPFYIEAERARQRQRLGVTTRTPLPLLRLARLLSLKGLDREQRNTVLRQVRRGEIEALWFGSECPTNAFGDCLAALGQAGGGLRGHFRIADLALTPVPRAPGLTIAALSGQMADGRLAVGIEDGSGSGFRLTGGRAELLLKGDAPISATGTVAYAGPVSDFVAMAGEAFDADMESVFAVRAGSVRGTAAFRWPAPAADDESWLDAKLQMHGLRGRAAHTLAVDDASMDVDGRVFGAGDTPRVLAELRKLDAQGPGWSASGLGSFEYEGTLRGYEIALASDLKPELLGILLPENDNIDWSGAPIRLAVNGRGSSLETVELALSLDGGQACLRLVGDTQVLLKDCDEPLSARGQLTLDPQSQRYALRRLEASLAGEALIADGELAWENDALVGRVDTGRVSGRFLTSRLPDGRVRAVGGHADGLMILRPEGWTVQLNLASLELAEPLALRADGRIDANASTARVDLALRPELTAVPEVRLNGSVRDLGPAPQVEATIRIPSIEIPRVPTAKARPASTGSAPAEGEAPVLLPELDRLIVSAPDTFVPGRGAVSLRVDSVNLASGGGGAGHIEGALNWDGQGQRLTLDWLRDGQIAAALFAEVQQAAAGASALSRLRFATSDVDTALISRLLVGRPIARSGAVGMRLDLQGPWQRSLRRWSGFLELRGEEIDLTEAELLAQTIAASGASSGAIPGVLNLRRASVQGRLGGGLVTFEPVYLETNVGTVFGHLGASLEDNRIDGLAVVGPLKDLQDLFQLLPGLHSVGDAVEALRFAVKIDGTLQEPGFQRIGNARGNDEPELVRTLQDTLRKLQSFGAN